MRAFSVWFESIGVSPVVGGLLLGLALGFLLFRKRAPRDALPLVPPRAPEVGARRSTSGDDETKRLAVAAIERGNKLEAVKLVRDREKTDLRSAKERVDEWAREIGR